MESRQLTTTVGRLLTPRRRHPLASPKPGAYGTPAQVRYGEAVHQFRQSVTLLESSVCSHYLMWLAQMMPRNFDESETVDR